MVQGGRVAGEAGKMEHVTSGASHSLDDWQERLGTKFTFGTDDASDSSPFMQEGLDEHPRMAKCDDDQQVRRCRRGYSIPNDSDVIRSRGDASTSLHYLGHGGLTPANQRALWVS